MANSKAKELLDFVNHQFGSQVLKFASDEEFEVKMLPTGLAPIDDLFEGGIPLGRHIMLHGDYSTLKSYVGLCAIAAAQKAGLVAALVDAEKTFDPSWARALGVDLKELVLPPRDKVSTGERAIDLIESLTRGGCDLIVVDSVASLLPNAEYIKSMEDSKQLGRQAEMMSKALRKITAAMSRTCIIWINQTRINPNIMFGSQESIPAGKALPFYCTYIAGFYHAGKARSDVEIWVTGEDGRPVKKKVKQTTGMRIRVDLRKSKLNKPNRDTHFVYNLETGAVDDWDYLANRALGLGLLGYERGRWWTPEDGKKMTHDAFRGHLPIEELKKLLHGTVPGVDSAGVAPRAKKKAPVRRRKSSETTAPVPTPAPARGRGSSTARTNAKPLKSKTPTRATSSTTRTSASSAAKPRSTGTRASSSSSSRR